VLTFLASLEADVGIEQAVERLGAFVGSSNI